ncbi:MAG TPA: LysR substrate-binding domain-containing protein [Arenicellales bacterium]|nr:LysR substrate-binding domain-containing protein [Arenicellales bacterium]
MISLKQIQHALAVEKTLHFKKAAEQCAISQSALSTSLAEMEKQLGYQVFERSNKQVLVTPIGRQMLAKAREIRLLVEDVHKLVEQERAPLSGRLSIGMIPTVGPYLLPILLPALESDYPDLRLEVEEAQSDELLELLRKGELDTAILALPYEHEGLLAFKFWQEDFYWVTHAEDELADKPVIQSQELEPTDLMLLKEGHCLKEHALAACRFPAAASHGLQATSLLTLVQMVAGRMGSTLVPEMALEQLVAHNPALVAIPLSEPGPHRELAFLVRPNYPGVSNIELLRDRLRQALAAAIRGRRAPLTGTPKPE